MHKEKGMSHISRPIGWRIGLEETIGVSADIPVESLFGYMVADGGGFFAVSNETGPLCLLRFADRMQFGPSVHFLSVWPLIDTDREWLVPLPAGFTGVLNFALLDLSPCVPDVPSGRCKESLVPSAADPGIMVNRYVRVLCSLRGIDVHPRRGFTGVTVPIAGGGGSSVDQVRLYTGVPTTQSAQFHTVSGAIDRYFDIEALLAHGDREPRIYHHDVIAVFYTGACLTNGPFEAALRHTVGAGPLFTPGSVVSMRCIRVVVVVKN